ncbi:MAG: glycoside hydrolase family 3 C-terminal domain-containing protein [Clostridia bacterium]|nr:glycoside hydrolase family 3 C-terminal domain-containing protein [Clostridia bacterium]
MKKKLITHITAMLLLVIIFTGCEIAVTPTPSPSPTPEDGDCTLVAHRLMVKNGKLSLGLTLEAESSGKLELTLKDAEGVISSAVITAEPGYSLHEISCPEDKTSGELELTVGCKGESIMLKLKGGAPQLTRDGVKCVINAMTLKEKATFVSGVREPDKKGSTGETYAIPRLGIPSLEMADGPAGIRYTVSSVWYPSVSNLSSSWDRDLALSVGRAIGTDALALGFDIVLAPGMNLQKNLLCGRNFEYSSEDPLLTAHLASSYVNGIQSTGAQACIKHFAANSQESARYTVSSNLTERALREMYLKAFAYVIKQSSPAAVMSSYNRINGEYASNSHELLTEILRGEMGFNGLVMSDWDSKGDITDKLNAGNDLNMPGNADDPDKVIAAINNGTVKLAALDSACENILNVLISSPSFNGLDMNDRNKHRDNVKQHEALSGNAAADTMVLLKNNGALPFKEDTCVALFGNGAFKTVFGGAGSGSVSPTDRSTVASGINKSSSLSVYEYASNIFKGCDPHIQGDESADVKVSREYASSQATGADAAVVVFSRDSQESYDRSSAKGDFLLNDTERTMLELVSEEFHALGKKVVVIINTSAPMEVASWRDLVDGIIYCGYAGQATGTAVASILSGKVNPSAKTTSSWPISYSDTPCAEAFPGNALDVTYFEDIYVGYRYYSTFGVDVAYPFGYGLSYTEFEYKDISLKDNGDSITVNLTVKNTGKLAGKEVVQLYVSKPETLQEQASIELCGFEKTGSIAPGEAQSISITFNKDELATYCQDTSSWILQDGEYKLAVGKSSAELISAGSFTQYAPKTVSDVENRCVPDEDIQYIKKGEYDPNAPQTRKENLALNKKTWSNFCEGASFASDYAVDGSRTSRWSGFMLTDRDHVWQVDLGASRKIGKIDIFWQAIGKPFTVYTSADGESFTKYRTYTCDASLQSSINLRGTEARFIRIEIARGSFVSIFEFNAYEATDADIQLESLTNIALNKQVSASEGQSEHPKENAVDGDLSTRWSAQYSGKAFLEVDLGAERTVKGVELALESAWNSYKLEYSSDGKSYTTLTKGAKDQLSLTLEDISISARYLRVTRDGDGWFSIMELTVLG